ncbi:MAG: hypothetical protein WHX52_17595 [Anaerolineae bacterium]
MYSKLHLKLGGLLIVGLALLLGTSPLWAQVAPPPLPTRPLPTATPTPILTPTLVPPETGTPESVPAQSAQSSAIVLEARFTANLVWANLWTVIERQTENGVWQAVEGWQGTFDTVAADVGYKTWGVPSSLFGQGPFRWRVATARDGSTLATSQPFTLPERAGVRFVVVVTLPSTSQPILLPATGASTGWVGVLLVLVSLLLVWRLRNGSNK